MAVLAGMVAERKIKSVTTYAEQDQTNALELSGQFFANLKTAEAFCNYIILEVQNCFSCLIKKEENEIEDTTLWNFVLKLSDQLMIQKEVSFKVCKKLYRESLKH